MTGLGDSSLAYCQGLTSGPDPVANFALFVTTPSCWGWGIPNSVAYAGFNPPPAPAPAPAVTNYLDTNVPTLDQAAAATQQSLDAMMTATQAQNRQFFNATAQSQSAFNFWLLALLALGGFLGYEFLRKAI